MGLSQLALTHDEQESRDQPDASGMFLPLSRLCHGVRRLSAGRASALGVATECDLDPRAWVHLHARFAGNGSQAKTMAVPPFVLVARTSKSAPGGQSAARSVAIRLVTRSATIGLVAQPIFPST